MLRICLTGGPCAGKSSAFKLLEMTLSARGYKVLFVPETASELILNGIIPGDKISLFDFQKFVLKKQIEKENLYEEMARYYNKDRLIIFYDRGILDQLAYIERSDFEDMLKEESLSIAKVYDRYDAVLHLVTAADGAEKFYEWNDPESGQTGNNAARSESPEEARIKDKKTLNGWIGHPHLRVFDNSTDFNTKIQKVLEEVYTLLGEPIPHELERKFLIKMPSEKSFEEMGDYSMSEIIQTYLKTDGDVERRIRQRGTQKDGFSFFYTEKKKITELERSEEETKIDVNKYISLMAFSDTSLHQISKKRYCFVYDRKYFEMDVYPFSDEYAILEIELSEKDEAFNLPPFLEIVREVTYEKEFKNKELARVYKFNI